MKPVKFKGLYFGLFLMAMSGGMIISLQSAFANAAYQEPSIRALGQSNSEDAPPEIRPLSRPIDRIYHVVTGEADASAVVQNPANLSNLAGINGVIDATWMHQESGRRGSGVAAQLALPLVARRLSLGLGYQWQYRLDYRHRDYNEQFDPSYTRLSLGVGYSLDRWLPGVSLGTGYSRLMSRSNFPVRKMNFIDLAISWRATNWLSMAMVVRGINQPHVDVRFLGLGDENDEEGDSLLVSTSQAIPLEVQPEIAVRPWASKKQAIELAAGARLIGAKYDASKLIPYSIQPIARFILKLSGIRVFVSAQGVSQYESSVPEMVISAGLMVDTEHLGVGAGMHVNTADNEPENAFDGASVRFRISSSSYPRSVSIPARRVERIVLSDFRGDRGLRRVVDKIDSLAANGDPLLLIESKAHGFDYAELEEIREALFRFRDRGKAKVVAYMDGGNLRDYYLASATDRIIAHPKNSLQVSGMVEHVYYFGDLLAKLGIHAEMQRVGSHKGQPEILSSNGPSKAVSDQHSTVLSDRWNHVVRQIARERGFRPTQFGRWIDHAPISPVNARLNGMVDDLAWPDQLESRMEEWVNRRLHVERSKDKIVDRDGFGTGKVVAILYIDGDLVDGNSSFVPNMFGHQVGVENIINTIIKLRRNRRVKAIVVRINSRGGTIWAARAIARELDLAAREKYVVASLGRQATSAGYYIAASAKFIFADATTVTGSIGAFHTKLDLSKALAEVGINADVRWIGERATLNTWCLPSNRDHLQAAREPLTRFYDEFVDRVAYARSMTRKEVLEIADGRIWSGARAIELGLVDEYGGLREAIHWALRVKRLHTEWVNFVEEPHLSSKPDSVLKKISHSLVLQVFPNSHQLAQLPVWAGVSQLLRRLPLAIWTCGSEQFMAMSDVDYRWD